MWRQFQTLGIALAAVPLGHALSPRTDINVTYDFVVVGGGQAGLVLGGRLSEDTNHTVLVLESGGNGDEYRERIGVYLLLYLSQRGFELTNTAKIRLRTRTLILSGRLR
jgi:choline dehydrogenase-like flavoprotein